MKSSRPFEVEQLEDRCVPATWGNPWPDGAHLTLSFAPDGTAVGTRTSALFSTLNAIAPTATWEHEILRAFQTWAAQANINIGVVPDGGQPFGTPGAPEGDPRFGDIRLAAYPMGALAGGEVAVASPFDVTAGTWSGDVKLNTSYQFSIGGAHGIDLYTATLHEAAHALGLPDSTDPKSAVYENYQAPRTGLGGSDVANIQALYGARTPDGSNGTFATATPLTLLSNGNGSLGIQVTGDIGSLSDADVYRFQAPLNVGSMAVHLHTAGISLLDARITVYDSAFRVVGSAVATNPLNNELTVNVTSAKPLGTYYVKVQSASGDVFGIGGYGLEIDSVPLLSTTTSLLSSTTQSLVQTVNTIVPLNTSFLTATLLPPITSQTNSRFDASFHGSINSGSTQEYFRVVAPQPPAGQPNVMTAMVWGTDSRQLKARLDVYDANQNLVPATVLVNENGTFTVQVGNAVAGASYYIKVSAVHPNGPNNTGSYLLGIDFSTVAANLQTVTSGTLGAAQAQSSGTLTVQQGELIHFVLSAHAADPSAAAAVRLTILDAKGVAVATVVAYNGQDAVSLTQVLGAGTYTILITEYAPAGSALPPLSYELQATRLDDPIGPQAQDSTTAPAGSTTTTSSGSTTTTSTSTTSTSSSSDYYYYQPSGSSSLSPQDPYSSPYQPS